MSEASHAPPAGGESCRICGQPGAMLAGEVEYFVGYKWPVYDCARCGCRFTQHDNTVYNVFHESGAISYYGEYRDMAEECRKLFEARDIQGLRAYLARSTKYRFIMAEVDPLPHDARILEVGCSRGYLTSYFILQGRRVLGIDISEKAIEAATMAFGDHFALASAGAAGQEAPYDLIYHVGMIGCVADPIGFTRGLLAMLKRGGKLIFNAPNRAACWMKHQLWFDSAPPPDLVTMYPEGFWRERFAGAAEVQEGIELCDENQSLEIAWRKQLGGEWRAPRARTINLRSARAMPASRLASRGFSKLARMTNLSRVVTRLPSEFGLFVKMRPR